MELEALLRIAAVVLAGAFCAISNCRLWTDLVKDQILV